MSENFMNNFETIYFNLYLSNLLRGFLGFCEKLKMLKFNPFIEYAVVYMVDQKTH